MIDLPKVARRLVDNASGILAADESISTMSKRLQAAGVEPSAETRRDYRALLVTTPGLSASISGVILCDETLRQTLPDGTPIPAAALSQGIDVGIKVDTGTCALPFAGGGLITEGLDGLRARLIEYRRLGATFAKWRAVLDPAGFNKRTGHANAHALARYAALCQENGLVPIVEPEVLMDGTHEIAICQSVSHAVLGAVFEELDLAGVDLSAIVLKPNMVVSGADCPTQASPEEVARRTLSVLQARVPAAVPGIAFLSGGQSNAMACGNLTAINDAAANSADAPWALTFSFGRALIDDVLHTWAGNEAAIPAAQQTLLENCARATGAVRGADRLAGTRG